MATGRGACRHGRATRKKITARFAWEDRDREIGWSIKQGREKRAKYGADARPWTSDELAHLQSEPLLDVGALFIRQAYVQLSTCRSIGMMPGPIPWTAAADWCRLNNVKGRAAKHLIDVTLLVDGAYLTKLADKTKTPAGNPQQ